MHDPNNDLPADPDEAPETEPSPRQRRQTHLVYGLMAALAALALAWVLWHHAHRP